MSDIHQWVNRIEAPGPAQTISTDRPGLQLSRTITEIQEVISEMQGADEEAEASEMEELLTDLAEKVADLAAGIADFVNNQILDIRFDSTTNQLQKKTKDGWVIITGGQTEPCEDI